MEKAKGVKLGGLWKQLSQDGKSITCLSGNLGMARIVIFPVKEKKGEKYPDFDIVLYPQEKKEETPAGPTL